MDTETQSQVIQARARIMWGDSIQEVKAELMNGGLTEQEAVYIIECCLQEREKEIRNRGLRELVIGGGILIITVAILIAQYLAGTFFSKESYTTVLVLGYGLWKMLDGVFRVFGAAKEKGSVTEM